MYKSTLIHILSLALLCSVSAPEASTLPSHTSDLGPYGPTLDQRDQDHNHSHGLMTYGLSHGLMTYGHDPGSLPVDTLTTPNHSGKRSDQSGAHSLNSQDQEIAYSANFRLGSGAGTPHSLF